MTGEVLRVASTDLDKRSANRRACATEARCLRDRTIHPITEEVMDEALRRGDDNDDRRRDAAQRDDERQREDASRRAPDANDRPGLTKRERDQRWPIG